MNPNSKTQYLIALACLAFLLAGCGPGQLLGPTVTPTPTATPTSTPTLTPTPTSTPTLTPTPIPPGQVKGQIFLEGVDQPYVSDRVDSDVILYSVDAEETVERVLTDNDGYYLFDDVEPGNYVVALHIPLTRWPWPCKLKVGDEEGWTWDMPMELSGGSFQVTGVTYQSLKFEMQGTTIQIDLDLTCD